MDPESKLEESELNNPHGIVTRDISTNPSELGINSSGTHLLRNDGYGQTSVTTFSALFVHLPPEGMRPDNSIGVDALMAFSPFNEAFQEAMYKWLFRALSRWQALHVYAPSSETVNLFREKVAEHGHYSEILPLTMLGYPSHDGGLPYVLHGGLVIRASRLPSRGYEWEVSVST